MLTLKTLVDFIGAWIICKSVEESARGNVRASKEVNFARTKNFGFITFSLSISATGAGPLCGGILCGGKLYISYILYIDFGPPILVIPPPRIMDLVKKLSPL